MDFSRLFTRVNYTVGQLAEALDWNRTGATALRNIFDALGWTHGALDGGGLPERIDGAPKDSSLLVTDNGGYTLRVRQGALMINQGSATPDDFLPTVYNSIVLEADQFPTMTTPGAFPRVDVVRALPATVTDVNDSRAIKTTGIALTPIDTRFRYTGTVDIVEGTAGSDGLPLLVGEFVELARVVHRSAGVYEIYDSRPIIEVSEGWKAGPMEGLASNYVYSRGDTTDGTDVNSLLVTEADTPALFVYINSGIAVPKGRAFRVPWTRLLVTAADPVLVRNDLVVISSAGVPSLLAGTPGAGDPVVPAGNLAIARVNVAPAATAINNGDIDDLREVNRWLDGDVFKSTAVLGGGVGPKFDDARWNGAATHSRTWSLVDIQASNISAAAESIVGVNITSADPNARLNAIKHFEGIPEGAFITQVQVDYERNNAVASLAQVDVFVADANGNLVLGVAAIADSGATTGDQTLTQAIPAWLVPAKGRVMCEVKVENGGVIDNVQISSITVEFITSSIDQAVHKS